MKYIFAVTYETAWAEDGASHHDASRKAPTLYLSHFICYTEKISLPLG